jgi:hypothetical protein
MIPKSEQDVLDAFGFKIPKLNISWGKKETLIGYTVRDNHIVRLKIIGQELEFLPENIGNLTALEIFMLKDNDLQFLPESFGNLGELRHLELSKNNLSFLPDSFGNLKNLESINLIDNNIIYLPESFKNLEKLRILDLCHNKLRSFSNVPLSIRESQYLSDTLEIPDHVWDRILRMTLDLNLSPGEPLDLGVIEVENEYDFEYDEYEFVDINLDGEGLLVGNLPLKLKHLPYFERNSRREYENYDEQERKQFFEYYYQNKKEFFTYYAKSPFVLAQQYIQDPNSLTSDEKERLAWEGSFRERKILEIKVQPNNPILCAINNRLLPLELHNVKETANNNIEEEIVKKRKKEEIENNEKEMKKWTRIKIEEEIVKKRKKEEIENNEKEMKKWTRIIIEED